MMNDHGSVSDVKLVVSWTIAAAIAAAVALLAGQVLLIGLGSLAWHPPDEVLMGAALGLFLGLGQWSVLRTRILRSGWWMLSSLGGGLVFGLAANQAGNQVGLLAAFTAFGLVQGACQWPVLRGRIRNPALWILAGGIAWAIGPQAIQWTDRIAPHVWWPFGELATVALTYAVLGSFVGLISGIVLAWTMRITKEGSRPSAYEVAA
jgi:hypothetical protein